MASVITLFVIAVVSLIAVRVGATALMMTGLSWDTASFQSYSAFFGVGFTTKEAEMVVNHPVRRRIIRDLILAGNVGLTSALAALVVSMMQTEKSSHMLMMVLGVSVAVALLLTLSRVGWLQRLLDRVIHRALEHAGMVRALDYELLLRIQHGYVVSEIEVLPDPLLAGRTLRESRPWDLGVVILAIKRDGETRRGIPSRDDLIEPGDVLTAYGKESDLNGTGLRRPSGKRPL
jgi:hypothetical protein